MIIIVAARRDAMPGVSNTTAGEFDSGTDETVDVSIPTGVGSISFRDARHGVSTANPEFIDGGYNIRNQTNQFGPQIKNLDRLFVGSNRP